MSVGLSHETQPTLALLSNTKVQAIFNGNPPHGANCYWDVILINGQWTYAYKPGTWTVKELQALPWKDWPQPKRNAAVNLLNNSDWQGFISSMPAGGILNPGDKIHAPTIVIPGQETDDPLTPADERLLKKQSGFFTFPGIPDFDQDGIPDSIDLDNDNDGIVNTNDSEPHNPNVPFASSLPDESAKVTPEVLQDIRDQYFAYLVA